MFFIFHYFLISILSGGENGPSKNITIFLYNYPLVEDRQFIFLSKVTDVFNIFLNCSNKIRQLMIISLDLSPPKLYSYLVFNRSVFLEMQIIKLPSAPTVINCLGFLRWATWIMVDPWESLMSNSKLHSSRFLFRQKISYSVLISFFCLELTSMWLQITLFTKLERKCLWC